MRQEFPSCSSSPRCAGSPPVSSSSRWPLANSSIVSTDADRVLLSDTGALLATGGASALRWRYDGDQRCTSRRPERTRHAGGHRPRRRGRSSPARDANGPAHGPGRPTVGLGRRIRVSSGRGRVVARSRTPVSSSPSRLRSSTSTASGSPRTCTAAGGADGGTSAPRARERASTAPSGGADQPRPRGEEASIPAAVTAADAR